MRYIVYIDRLFLYSKSAYHDMVNQWQFQHLIFQLNHEFYNRQKAMQLKVDNLLSNMNTEMANEISVIDQINNLSKEVKIIKEIKNPNLIHINNLQFL